MGSPGCGKTTLITCLDRLKSLDSGAIEILGEPPEALVNDFTVREMIWRTIYGLNAEKINERFQFLSELLEFPEEGTF